MDLELGVLRLEGLGFRIKGLGLTVLGFRVFDVQYRALEMPICSVFCIAQFEERASALTGEPESL